MLTNVNTHRRYLIAVIEDDGTQTELLCIKTADEEIGRRILWTLDGRAWRVSGATALRHVRAEEYDELDADLPQEPHPPRSPVSDGFHEVEVFEDDSDSAPLLGTIRVRSLGLDESGIRQLYISEDGGSYRQRRDDGVYSMMNDY